MKRLLIVVSAALLACSPSSRAQGPDDKYIDIYRIIQEGDQMAASGQRDSARQRFAQAQAELKKLQESYPNWNQKLVQFRLRALEARLGREAQPAPQAPSAAGAVVETPAATQPGAPVPVPARVEADERDAQINGLQEHVARLQNDRAVLEAKLREALSAQPAVMDPRELAKAEERIKALEKEKEILRLSLEAAEAKSAQNEAADLRRSISEAQSKLAEQNDIIVALRQEKEVLQQRLQTAARPDETATQTLRAENETLKKQLEESRRTAAQPPPAQAAQLAPPAQAAQAGADQELASTKAALQTSREILNSMQVRLRKMEEERDRMEKTRHELEAKLAAGGDPSQYKRLQKERDELQKKLTDADRKLAEAKSKKGRAAQPSDDVTKLRARLEVLEANKVPYTPEELALFKKPQEMAAIARPNAEALPAKELPETATPLLTDAQRAMTARRFDEAEKKYLEVLRMDEKNVATLQRLAYAQLEQDRPKDAEANLTVALEQAPSDPRTLLLLGIARYDQEKFDEALDAFSRSAQVDPQNAETQNYLGITLSHKGQRAAAETALRKAVQLSPNNKEAHYNLAVVYATQQPPFTELARWHYQKSLAYGRQQNPELEKLIERKQAAAQK
jgi:Tfp pilus assembly protein PilF